MHSTSNSSVPVAHPQRQKRTTGIELKEISIDYLVAAT